MDRKIFVWTAHPKANSLCASLADAYASGAARAGASVRVQPLWEMEVPADGPGDGKDPLNADLTRWQDNVAWADHIFIVHPYWWGAMPGKAKAVLDRALVSGFGYRYRPRGLGWDKLLTGRTAEAIITSDTPPFIDTLFYHRPGRRVLRNQVLGFCGVDVKRVLQIGPIKTAKEATIARWLQLAERMGTEAAEAPSRRQRAPLVVSHGT